MKHRIVALAIALSGLVVLGLLSASIVIPASPALAVDSIDNVSIDMDTSGNTNTSIGPTDTCISIASGASVSLDIVIGPVGIPPSRPSNAFALTLNSSSRVEVTAAQAAPHKFGPGFGIDPPLDPDGDGQFDFAYLNFGSPGVTGAGKIARITLHAVSAVPSVTNLTLTNVSIADINAFNVPIQNLGSAQIAVNSPCGSPDGDGDTVINSADNCPQTANYTQTNTDGDEYGDACEQAWCVNVVNHWAVPAGDSDCDAFTDTSETFAGTMPATMCASTAAANDEAGTDAWPVDFNDDQKANVLDVSQYSSRFGSLAPGPPYDVRYDFNGDDKINVLDVSRFSSLFGKICTP